MIAFHDLPAEKFPLLMQFFRASDRAGIKAVWSVNVESPGAVTIPPLARMLGEPIWVRITYGDGTIVESAKVE